MQLSDLITPYVNITKECSISKLGPPFTYYHSDVVKSNIMATDLIDLDVKSAFPTICKMMFGENHPFIQNLNKIEGKLQKNIFIATTLKKQSEIDGHPYLNDLNLWSKILILGYTYCKYNNINILQYVKDGLIFKGELRNERSTSIEQFLQFIYDNDVIFHEIPVILYVRFNKTSIVKYDSKMSVKGKFKNYPKYIEEIFNAFFNGNIYDSKFLSNIKFKYSKKFFDVLYNSSLKEEIDYYYKINDKYINDDGDLDILEHINPKIYLFQIIYPVLSLLRST